jgi:hypothetical protein
MDLLNDENRVMQKAEDGEFGACADIDFAISNGGHGELDGVAGFVAAGDSL